MYGMSGGRYPHPRGAWDPSEEGHTPPHDVRAALRMLTFSGCSLRCGGCAVVRKSAYFRQGRGTAIPARMWPDEALLPTGFGGDDEKFTTVMICRG
jgi:pyruvate-formate lyase-activating enzyme